MVLRLTSVLGRLFMKAFVGGVVERVNAGKAMEWARRARREGESVGSPRLRDAPRVSGHDATATATFISRLRPTLFRGRRFSIEVFLFLSAQERGPNRP